LMIFSSTLRRTRCPFSTIPTTPVPPSPIWRTSAYVPMTAPGR
jgi:hypothetical protein